MSLALVHGVDDARRDDEMGLYGPFELRGDATRPPDEEYGWEFAHGKAAEVSVPVEDVVRTA